MQKQKSLPELESEMHQHSDNIAALIKKKSQYESQVKTILTRAALERRKIRTHRLIERGAIAESVIPGAESFTNEQIKALLSVALNTAEARKFISKAAKEIH
jgi:hypothetical protein